MLIAVLVAISLCCCPSLSIAGDAAFDRLLDRTAAYVDSFGAAFRQILATESYEQRLQRGGGPEQRRLIESEVFFVSLNDSGGSMTVRRVLRVDGREVTDTLGRIEAALAAAPGDSRRALAQLANEGARYNLGDLTHNFSDPTLVLLFAADTHRRRFRFRNVGPQTIDGSVTTKIAFSERSRPTVIGDGRGGGFPASGLLYVSEDGRVHRTELVLKKGEFSAVLRVRYRHDERLGMLVPATMDEEYRYRRNQRSPTEHIVGAADYSNYRRFETSGRVVSPVP